MIADELVAFKELLFSNSIQVDALCQLLIAICTGAADKGTWVRIFQPPIEGRLLYGAEGVDVGHRLEVQLVRTDVEKGYIDFKKVE